MYLVKKRKYTAILSMAVPMQVT